MTRVIRQSTSNSLLDFAFPHPHKLLIFLLLLSALVLGARASAQNIVGNPTGSQTITQPSSTSLTVTGGNGLITQRLNNVRICTSYSGSDIGAQVNACMADLGSGGGEAIIPAGTYNLTTQINPLSNVWLHGQGKYATVLNATATTSLAGTGLSSAGPTATATAHLTGSSVSSITGWPTSSVYVYTAPSNTPAYTAPLVVLDPSPTGLSNTATATATINSSGAITGISVVSGGSGYTTAPGVYIYAQGPPATGVTGTLSGTAVNGISGYPTGCIFLSAPTVYIAPPSSGHQATATATMSSSGCTSGYFKITGFTITYGGTGYSSSPSVNIFPAEAVVRALGNYQTPITNFAITDLTISNGVPSTVNSTPAMDGIRFDFCNYCNIERTNTTSIQGDFGIVVKDSTYIKVDDNDVTNGTYGGIELLTGNDYVWVQRNNVTGLACLANGQTNRCSVSYSIASLSEDSPSPNAYGNNIWVQFNAVANNSYVNTGTPSLDVAYGEGLDAHGGTHLWYTDNTIDNVNVGINMNLASGGSSLPNLQDLHVERNMVNQGYGTTDGTGIFITTDGQSYPAEDIWVKDNWLYGFGSTNSTVTPYAGVITGYHTRDFHVIGNSCRAWSNVCILLYADDLGGEVTGNFAYDLNAAVMGSSSAMIMSATYGNFGIKVDGNQLIPPGASSGTDYPNYQILNVNEWNNLQIGLNYAKYINTSSGAQYSSFLPTEFQSQPVSGNGTGSAQLVLAYLDPIYDNFGRPQWRSSAVQPNPGLGSSAGLRQGYTSTDSSTYVAYGSMAMHSSTLNPGTSSGACTGSAFYLCLPEGANISIYNAGSSNCPNGTTSCLNGRVISNTVQNGIVLDTSPSTAFTNQPIVYQPSEITPAQTVLDGSQRFTSPGSTNQQGYWNQFGTSGVISSTGAAYSTTASNVYGFLSFNALPFATGQDMWTQASSGTQSSIAFLDPNGLHLRLAPASQSNGGFSTFWGSNDAITLNASTGLTTTGTLAMSRCASASGSCSTYSSGDVTIASGGTTVTVTTSAVTANSQIQITENTTKGTELSVTCNTTTGRTYEVTTVTTGTSFVITSSAAPSTHPACVSFTIIN